MIAIRQLNQMTPQEYLEWEPTQEIRYDYIDGEVFAMTGGTKPHNRIAGNIYTALDSHLQERGCEVYIADVKVQASENGPYHYPDVVVTCDPRDRNSNQFVQYPCLIVEVLSPSTEAFDRGGKFARYRQMETLQEYVLIQSEQIGVECFRRNEEGLWVLYPYESGDTFTLSSVGLSLSVDAVYRQVRFESTETEAS
ncbi:Uma2 family endonuclease [Funiculus sociatus GB2-A5]|uniref:Uma2 family endonuclease n=1 Tax=Funiculus sociatus GB2-A5 TaxID=2933946 RepID=A0ABV0JRN9_9CYAN|nr:MULTISPECIES: Uma2 family endonuclease [unclassified Trichocoleus]MBD1904980.1 Uma2 family endonuclease [Trichocoleus sp. FACHB-832]MBD2064050.1 Uma2 family endonuclease [Trichocoleus sp. FACHB-6]